MATARWFFQREPKSKFVIQEHLRQGYWRVGPSSLWIEAVTDESPYRAVGHWHDLRFELEWAPRDFVRLIAERADDELIRATTLQLGFKPARRYEQDGKIVVEWRADPATVVAAPPTPLAATPAIEMPNGHSD